MNSKITASTLVVGLIASASASAVPISPVNDRSPQIAVGSTVDPASACTSSGISDCELQTLIDAVLPGAGIDVTTDQETAGIWSLGGFGVQTANAVFSLEVTANALSQQLGIWSDLNGDTDGAGRMLVDIFLGGATAVNNGGATIASLLFVGGDLFIEQLGVDDGTVNEGIFHGIIDPSAFGFYLQPNGDSGNTWYSLDQLNGGSSQMLAFRDTSADRWAIGFEDQLYGSTNSDDDFQDAIFTIESIVPVPEPGTLVLLGAGLLALGASGSVRRRGRA